MAAEDGWKRYTEENQIQKIRLKLVRKYDYLQKKLFLNRQEEIFVKEVSRIFNIISKIVFIQYDNVHTKMKKEMKKDLLII